MRTDVRNAALLAAALILAGCAATPQSVDLPPIDNWETRTQVLASRQDWEFKGRIAVKSGDDGFNARFNWTQDGDAFNATVSGPLGMGTVRIDGDGSSVVLTDKDGETTVLDDAEADLRRRYGWTIPVASLRFWALGIPDPALPAAKDLDEEGRLARLAQSGWVVEITSYREGGGQPMPRILSAANPDTRVRMVIDRWLFFDR